MYEIIRGKCYVSEILPKTWKLLAKIREIQRFMMVEDEKCGKAIVGGWWLIKTSPLKLLPTLVLIGSTSPEESREENVLILYHKRRDIIDRVRYYNFSKQLTEEEVNALKEINKEIKELYGVSLITYLGSFIDVVITSIANVVAIWGYTPTDDVIALVSSCCGCFRPGLPIIARSEVDRQIIAV